ncbi:MAG: DUF559 domain-containing protein [Flavobacteriales bacterium]|nr:DUF559 domain-containing protein [Flavobacteriales bacterium]
MDNNKSNYNKNLKPLARNLRNDSTQGEIILWSQVLRAKKMCGYAFNRKFSLQLNETNMIVDFISRKLKPVIEIDGYSHNFKEGIDEVRDKILSEHGYTVLRILESDVKHDLNNVVRIIEAKVLELDSSPCEEG